MENHLALLLAAIVICVGVFALVWRLRVRAGRFRAMLESYAARQIVLERIRKRNRTFSGVGSPH
jgi:hypothetical protein